MAEKILKSKSNQESDQNKVEDSDLIEEDDDSKKKEHNITMQEKQNIEFWANKFFWANNQTTLIYKWAIFWAKFYLLWANCFQSLITIGLNFWRIWVKIFRLQGLTAI